MSLEIAFVLGIVLIMLVGLVFELARPDMIVFIALAIFLISGVLTPEEALRGFSNQGMLTIALLFMIAGTIQKSGLVDRLMMKMLSNAYTEKQVLFRLLPPVAVFSSFLNNTPIVVALTPIIRRWCSTHNYSPSKFLIPLSFATILGGTVTLMGTSTNLVVHGLLLDAGLEGFSVFQLAVIGIPITIIGIIYIILLGSKLLPNYKNLMEQVTDHSREYLSEAVVVTNSPLEGKSVSEAGLRNLKGLFLVSIIRQQEKITPVQSTTKLKSGDRLIFTGLISTLAELQNIRGLEIDTGTDLSLLDLKNGNTNLVEVVVSHYSSLLNKTVKESNFRSHYDAAVIAVHRNHERVNNKIGDIELKPGDTLLLLTGPDFKNLEYTNDFYVVTPVDSVPLKTNEKNGWLSIGILLLMISFVTLEVLSMFKAMIITIILLLVMQLTTPQEAKQHVQFNVLLLIASALGVGNALMKSGAANWIASNLVSVAAPLGIFALLAIVYILTNIFTELITNNAAAVMMFPISIEIAKQVDASVMAFAVTVTIAASASFASPIGYQTNLIVYGPGGYRFKDYMKIGIPLSLIVLIISITIINFVWI